MLNSNFTSDNLNDNDLNLDERSDTERISFEDYMRIDHQGESTQQCFLSDGINNERFTYKQVQGLETES